MEIANLSFTEITIAKHSYVSVTLNERCPHRTFTIEGQILPKSFEIETFAALFSFFPKQQDHLRMNVETKSYADNF